MGKLKTLKNIKHLGDCRNPGEQWCCVLEKDIREEAIKWIKVIEEKIKVIDELESKQQTPLQIVATKGLVEILESQSKLFKDFFNLTNKEVN